MIQPPSADSARSLLLVGRNSVHEPEREKRQALEGSITADASAPVGYVSEVKLCRTVRDLSYTLQGQAGVAAGLGLLPVPLLRYRREFLESLHTTVFSVSGAAGLRSPGTLPAWRCGATNGCHRSRSVRSAAWRLLGA